MNQSRSHRDRAFGRREVIVGAGAATVLGAQRRVFAQAGDEARGPAVWLDMDQNQLDDAYNNRVYAPNIDRVAEQIQSRNEDAKARLGPPLVFPYGPGPMETLSVYRADRTGAPVLVYIHGGTWRFGTADQYAYLAESFVHQGATVALVDFDFVEQAEDGLSTLARQVRDAVAWVYMNAPLLGGDPERIFVSGHSSGGHLAGLVLTTHWPERYDLPDTLIKGGLCASGMYDLEPVRLSWRNDYLNLTDESVEALSPERHIENLSAPLIVAYGTYETPEFRRQAQDFASIVQAAGKPVQLIAGDGYNHFEVRDTLANPFGLLGHAALSQMNLAPN